MILLNLWIYNSDTTLCFKPNLGCLHWRPINDKTRQTISRPWKEISCEWLSPPLQWRSCGLPKLPLFTQSRYPTANRDRDVLQLYQAVCRTHLITRIKQKHDQWQAQKYLESVSWSVIMIVMSNLVIRIVEREPNIFSIAVEQLQCASINLVSHLCHI